MFLPTVLGRYAVGATTFSRFYPSVTIGTIKLRPPKPDAVSEEPALQLEEVAFTIYYPADTSFRRETTTGVNWVIR